MPLEKPQWMQGALASFIAVIASQVLPLVVIPATNPENISRAFPFFALAILLAAFFMPLLWWRNKVGFIGSTAYGIFILIGWIIQLPALIQGRIPAQAAPFIIVAIIFSVSMIYFTAMAWRAKG